MRKTARKIGGPGREVEIDESKFGKRNTIVEKRLKTCWVFGGMEKQSNKCFFPTLERRDAETLIPIIKSVVKPGTTILSNCCWKAYTVLHKMKLEHVPTRLNPLGML